MTEQIRDPDLDRLVRELNRREGVLEEAEPASPAAAGPQPSLPNAFEPLDKPAQARVRRAGCSTGSCSK